jgi:hypothetical protein
MLSLEVALLGPMRRRLFGKPDPPQSPPGYHVGHETPKAKRRVIRPINCERTEGDARPKPGRTRPCVIRVAPDRGRVVTLIKMFRLRQIQTPEMRSGGEVKILRVPHDCQIIEGSRYMRSMQCQCTNIVKAPHSTPKSVLCISMLRLQPDLKQWRSTRPSYVCSCRKIVMKLAKCWLEDPHGTKKAPLFRIRIDCLPRPAFSTARGWTNIETIMRAPAELVRA